MRRVRPTCGEQELPRPPCTSALTCHVTELLLQSSSQSGGRQSNVRSGGLATPVRAGTPDTEREAIMSYGGVPSYEGSRPLVRWSRMHRVARLYRRVRRVPPPAAE